MSCSKNLFAVILSSHIVFVFSATKHFTLANQPYMIPDRGWQLLAGDFFTGPEGFLTSLHFTDILITFPPNGGCLCWRFQNVTKLFKT